MSDEHDCAGEQTGIIKNLLNFQQTKVDVAVMAKDLEVINARVSATEKSVAHVEQATKNLTEKVDKLSEKVEDVPLIRQIVEGIKEDTKYREPVYKEPSNKDVLKDKVGKGSMILVGLWVLLKLGLSATDAASLAKILLL